MDAIESRRSIRNYVKKPLESNVIEKIGSYLNKPENLIGPYGTSFKFELLIENDLKEKEKIGTYGFIKNVPGFIIGSCANDFKIIFEYGFVLEGLILYLTELGIGTCWLGGTFKRQEAMSSIALSENDIIPAIAAIGYSQEKEHLKSWVARKILKANQRKPENLLFFYETFEQSLENRADVYQQALRNVRLGPSAMNKQPWRIVVSSDLSKVHFYIASALADNKAYACEPEYIDIGIAYKHFKIGIDSLGITGKLKIDPPEISNPKEYIYITTWHQDSI